MKKHTKIYMQAMGYNDTDFIPCEISGNKANDIHHIISRGRGGKDRIENLMALTRENHLKYGDKNKYMIDLLFIHEKKLQAKGVEYDKQWFKDNYRKYDCVIDF